MSDADAGAGVDGEGMGIAPGDVPRRVYTVWRRTSSGAEVLGPSGPVPLNHAATRIWELIDDARPVAAIVSAMAREHPDIDPAVLRADVLEFLRFLAASDLAVTRWPPAAWLPAARGPGGGARRGPPEGGVRPD